MNSTDDRVELLQTPIDVAGIVASIGDPAAGAIVTFLGTTRAETDPAGKKLLALDYHAYEEMAIKQMKQLVQEARKRWPIQRAAIVHRLGRVEVGQPSVLIAVSSPHRDQAFSAGKFLIDSIKADATIWKKDVWSDGTQTWVDAS